MRLRPAAMTDCDLLFDWVNRPDSLAGKLRTTGPIDRATHERWLGARLADPDTRMSIIEDDGTPVGQVRLQRSAEGYEIDIYVVAAARRHGLAREALAQMARTNAAWRAGAPLIARVLPANTTSQRLFAAAGYRLADRSETQLVYRHDA